MNKKFLILILILIFVQSVFALGITPGRTTANFDSGLHKEVSFSVVNTEGKDMNIVFAVQGELANYITISQTYAEFSSADESKSFNYVVDLPQNIGEPGLHEAEIMALEMPKDMEEQGSFVGATVAVVSQLHVYVPYPSKYLDAELNVIEEGDDIKFIVPVVNRGDLDVVDAKAVIDIYTALNEKVATIESGSVVVNSLERKDLYAEWTPNVNSGKYLAIATIVYDNEVLELEKEFNVGEMVLEILEIVVDNFELGEIAKFDAFVENKWSNDLTEVYLNILVYNEEGEIMADFKSPTYDIDSLSKSEMVAYWDTAGVHEGEYNGKVILKYGDKSTDRNVQLKISKTEIEVVGFTGHVLVQGEDDFDMQSLLIIIVGVLVLANIVWFVLIRKILKKKK